MTIPKEKYCPKCRKTRPSGEWHRDGNSRDGLQRHCAHCQNRAASRWRRRKLRAERRANERAMGWLRQLNPGIAERLLAEEREREGLPTW